MKSSFLIGFLSNNQKSILIAKKFCPNEFLFTFTPYENCPNEVFDASGIHHIPSGSLLCGTQRPATANPAATAGIASGRRYCGAAHRIIRLRNL